MGFGVRGGDKAQSIFQIRIIINQQQEHIKQKPFKIPTPSLTRQKNPCLISFLFILRIPWRK